jgi:hypothetical protein
VLFRISSQEESVVSVQVLLIFEFSLCWFFILSLFVKSVPWKNLILGGEDIQNLKKGNNVISLSLRFSSLAFRQLMKVSQNHLLLLVLILMFKLGLLGKTTDLRCANKEKRILRKKLALNHVGLFYSLSKTSAWFFCSTLPFN